MAEIIIALGIVFILAATALVAISPGAQMQAARNNQRRGDASSILGAMGDYRARNGGELPACVTDSWTDVADCGELFPDYLSEVPEDPDSDCPGSGYSVKLTELGRVSVRADCAEDEEIIAGDRSL